MPGIRYCLNYCQDFVIPKDNVVLAVRILKEAGLKYSVDDAGNIVDLDGISTSGLTTADFDRFKEIAPYVLGGGQLEFEGLNHRFRILLVFKDGKCIQHEGENCYPTLVEPLLKSRSGRVDEIFTIIESALESAGYKILDGDCCTAIIRPPQDKTDYMLKLERFYEEDGS